MTALTGVAAALRDVVAALQLGPLWVTRDSDPVTGEVEDYVDVWSAAPVRHLVSIPEEAARRLRVLRPAPAVTWVTADFDLTGRVARIPLAAAAATFATVPEDDRQCVRIG